MEGLTCEMDVDCEKMNSERRLTFGRLLLLTQKTFWESYFLALIITDPNDEGVKITLQLKFPPDSKLSLAELTESSFTVMEAEGFFFRYSKVLMALSRLNERNFPMAKYIVYGTKNTQVCPPAYLQPSSLYKIFGHEDVPVMDFIKWPSINDLDPCQLYIISKALTEEIVLIQGPPGTGKTHIGTKLVQVLLDNVSVWNPDTTSPLLVVCQSNQALDRFLEGILKFTDNIVRVGNQSSNRIIRQYCMKELVCRKLVESFPEEVSLKEVCLHLQKLDQARKLIQLCHEGIISPKTLQSYKIICEETFGLFGSDFKFLKWLGFRIKKKFLNEEDTDLILSSKQLEPHVHQLELDENSSYTAVQLKEEQQKVEDIVLKFKRGSIAKHQTKTSDLLALSPDAACGVYLSWIDAFHAIILKEVEVMENQFHKIWSEVLPSDFKNRATLDVLIHSMVIGMTATAAAAYHSTLTTVCPKIVIVDEAAELLESNVVVTMTEACQHLIMIGDHKQLKPTLTTHSLGELYNLNISLFERLLRNEVVKVGRLTTQYRMCPGISTLLKPHFYDVLYDAPCTLGWPHLQGFTKNMFFIEHYEREQRPGNEKGWWNPYEVEILIKLAEYLVGKGYSPSNITIMAMYTEQKRKLIEARDLSTSIGNISVVSVDSFQGNQNDIILLSLVRSNSVGSIGFLSDDNRICVALSRARLGLFIVGNLKCLARGSETWQIIQNKLKGLNAVGRKVPLKCEQHKRNSWVCRPEDVNSSFCRVCVPWEKAKAPAADTRPKDGSGQEEITSEEEGKESDEKKKKKRKKPNQRQRRASS